MVALTPYNVADLPDTGGSMPLIPPAQYPAVIVHSEMKPTKDQQGQYLALKIVITQGQYANTEFTERLNIVNKNSQAVEIAYKTLARISEALGMQQTPSDSVQLHNKPLMIQVETEAGTAYVDNGVQKMGKDKSIIRKYLPVPGVGGMPAAGGFAPPAAVNTPAFGNAQPAAVATPNFGQPAQPQPTAVPANNPFAPPR